MISEASVLLSTIIQKTKKLEDGWTYSGEFNHFQKVNNKVYVYVTKQLFGRWVAQMYLRGDIGLCTLEARVNNGEPMKLFEIADTWLNKYGDNIENVEEDIYFPFQKNWKGEDINNN